MWPQVTRGENLYMFPYVDTVDTVLDTTHAYEPCVFAAELLPLLEAVPADSPFAQRAESLAAALRRFQPPSAREGAATIAAAGVPWRRRGMSGRQV